jgi:NADPH:quinone reductase
VVPLSTSLDWASLAAIPESYATAWSALFGNMKLQQGQRVLIRGGTSSLGRAAINIAAAVPGVSVITTTRKAERAAALRALGATTILIEGPTLHEKVRAMHPEGIDGVLDIIGNTTLLDSARMLRRDGYLCNAGFLGGGAPIAFNPLTDLPSGVNLNLFASFMFGTREFPLNQVPLQEIVTQAQKGIYKTRPYRVFEFPDVPEAHRLMESDAAEGKIVVRL